jgi:catechol 2,3-dioxygenase-like lactoylglutathione lyase family enzyme
MELITVPVSDVDRTKTFYVDQLSFTVEQDVQVDERHRFVELMPPGSACAIAVTLGYFDTEPGSVKGLQLNVDDADEFMPCCRSRCRSVRHGGTRLEPLLLLLRSRRDGWSVHGPRRE